MISATHRASHERTCFRANVSFQKAYERTSPAMNECSAAARGSERIASSKRCGLRATSVHDTPSAAKRPATARPMPRLPPVMRADRPPRAVFAACIAAPGLPTIDMLNGAQGLVWRRIAGWSNSPSSRATRSHSGRPPVFITKPLPWKLHVCDESWCGKPLEK